MYSFNPLVDTTWDVHTGFYGITFLMVLWMGLMVYVWGADEIRGRTVGIWFVICSLIVWLAYTCSYVPQKQYANTKVTGEFVSFTPEVWTEKSGKNSYTVKRQMYVTYRVGDSMVVLPANPNVDYPKTVQLYKN